MAAYILFITLNNAVIEHPYKFAYVETCQKVGKEIASIKKSWRYKCIFVKKV